MLNKKICTPVLVALFIGTVANAKTFNSACPDIVACIKSVSALTGEQYLIDVSELKLAQKAEILPDVELTAENANLFLTSLLHSTVEQPKADQNLRLAQTAKPRRSAQHYF